MELDLLMRHSIGNVDVYAAESVEMLLDHWQAKYAAVVAELECAQNDIELRDREIAALKARLKDSCEIMSSLNAELSLVIAENDNYREHMPSLAKLKAEAIREIGGLVHDGQIKVTVMQVPHTVDWVDAVEWFEEVANDIERGES